MYFPLSSKLITLKILYDYVRENKHVLRRSFTALITTILRQSLNRRIASHFVEIKIHTLSDGLNWRTF